MVTICVGAPSVYWISIFFALALVLVAIGVGLAVLLMVVAALEFRAVVELAGGGRWRERADELPETVKTALLYTEMITAAAIQHGDAQRLLAYNDAEHPVALQLGGSDPRQMAAAARLVHRATLLRTRGGLYTDGRQLGA